MNKYSQVFFTSIILSSLIALTGCSSNAPILGVDNGQLTPCPDKPNCVNSFAEDEAHHINPIVSKGSDGVVKNNILNVINSLENSKVTATESRYVRAEFTSDLFGFVDDVEFYFPESSMNQTTIHVRSASRLGYSDFNVNRERVESLRLKLEALEK
tara:strand:+ start:32 stop:499 length:468 start_codon:yes stop_codon:yes gene_type:complete